jgi:putative Ca2+/H+ antiporter (TMEM165/GDT1 family)
VPWIIGLSFIAVGLWVLIPDKDDEDGGAVLKYGAFVATCILFFLAEIGDKTQIATVILAARYDSLFWVVVGTTLGMLLANVPVAYAGSWLMQKIPLNVARWAACLLFVGLGVATLLTLDSF